VRKRASQIAEVTRTRYMPPWPPEPGYGDFVDARRLSDEQIARIATWVEQGALEGEAGDLPEAPSFPSDWPLGPPDLLLEMDETYTLRAEGSDVFRNFVFSAGVKGTHYVRAIDMRPGNKQIVHHANVLVDRTGASRRLDAEDPELGFEGMELLIESDTFEPHSHFLFWKPGTPPFDGGDEMAWRLDEDTDLVFNMHLQPSGKPEPIRAVIALYFADRPPKRQPMLLQLERDGALDIPPGERSFTVTDELELPTDVDVLGVYPHAHYLGEQIHGWATLPDGRRKWLIRIDDWDLNWQAVYRYQEPVFLPKGTRLEMRYTYDNSAENPQNPHVPPRRVRAGNRSEDEMAHLWLQVLPRVPPRDRVDARIVLQEALMRQRLRKYPGEFVGHFNMGSVLQYRGQLEDALGHFERALLIRPRDATALTSMGAALHQMGRSEEAVVRFREALAARPAYSHARYDLGSALIALGRDAEASDAFAELLRHDPQDVDVLNNLGYLSAKKGDLAQALEYYRRSARLAPDDADTLSTVAHLLTLRGELAEAESHYELALRLDPGHAEARRELDALRVLLRGREGEP
jgi:tetratricopeptide (TPR) repeat protein